MSVTTKLNITLSSGKPVVEECEENQTLVNNVCVDIGPGVEECKDNEELIDGDCKEKCKEDEERNEDGVCQKKQSEKTECKDNEELVNGICKEKCKEDEERNEDGVCQKRQSEETECKDNEELNKDGVCVEKTQNIPDTSAGNNTDSNATSSNTGFFTTKDSSSPNGNASNSSFPPTFFLVLAIILVLVALLPKLIRKLRINPAFQFKYKYFGLASLSLASISLVFSILFTSSAEFIKDIELNITASETLSLDAQILDTDEIAYIKDTITIQEDPQYSYDIYLSTDTNRITNQEDPSYAIDLIPAAGPLLDNTFGYSLAAPDQGSPNNTEWHPISTEKNEPLLSLPVGSVHAGDTFDIYFGVRSKNLAAGTYAIDLTYSTTSDYLPTATVIFNDNADESEIITPSPAPLLIELDKDNDLVTFHTPEDVPERDKNLFVGWNLDPNANEAQCDPDADCTISIEGLSDPITLYAIWQQAPVRTLLNFTNQKAILVYDADELSVGDTFQSSQGNIIIEEICETVCISKYSYGSKIITSVEIDQSFINYQPLSTYGWFSNYKINIIIGLENIDTSKTRNMSSMFSNSSLTSLSLPVGFGSQATNMSRMFYSSEISSLTIPNDADHSENNFGSKATNMSEMFRETSALTSLSLPVGFGSQATNMSRMFYRSKIVSLTIPNDTNHPENNFGSKATNMSGMFYFGLSTSYLTSLTLPDGFGSQATSMSNMFNGATALTSLTIPNDTDHPENNFGSKATNMSGMLSGVALTSLDLPDGFGSQATSMDRMFSGAESLVSITIPNDTNHPENNFGSKATNMSYMFNNTDSLTSLALPVGFGSQATSMQHMFAYARALSSLTIPNDADHPENNFGSKATNMSYMFNNANSLISVALPFSFGSQATSMQYMFHSANSLTSLKLPVGFGGQATDMYDMFNYDRSLVSLTIPNDADHPENNFGSSADSMSNMFSNTSSLTSLALPVGFGSQATSMHSMFSGTALTSLTLPERFGSQAIYMYNMFDGASSLTSLTLPAGFGQLATYTSNMFSNTSSLTSLALPVGFGSQATNMSNMFNGATALTSLTLPDGFGSQATSMSNMFNGATALTSLTIPNDTDHPENNFGSKAIDMSYMFNTNIYDDISSSLTSLDLPTGFGSQATNMSNMFNGATALTSLTIPNDTDHPENNFGSKATDMSYMFSNSALTSLTLPDGFGSQATDMHNMFAFARTLTSIIIPNDANYPANNFGSKANNMSKMFYYATTLTSLILPKGSGQVAADMSSMFEYASALSYIYLPEHFGEGVSNMSRMFYNTASLRHIFAENDLPAIANSSDMFNYASSLQNYNSSNINDATYAHAGLKDEVFGYLEHVTAPGSIKTIFTNSGEEAYLIYDDKNYTVEGTYKTNNDNIIIISDFCDDVCIKNNSTVTKVTIEPSFSNYKPTSTAEWFRRATNLTDINNLENLDTSETIDMHDMFRVALSLTSLTFPEHFGEKATNMSGMFASNRSFTFLTLPSGFGSSATNMSQMFYLDKTLTTIVLPKDFGQNAQNTKSMFSNSDALKNIYAPANTDLKNTDLLENDNSKNMFHNNPYLPNYQTDNDNNVLNAHIGRNQEGIPDGYFTDVCVLHDQYPDKYAACPESYDPNDHLPEEESSETTDDNQTQSPEESNGTESDDEASTINSEAPSGLEAVYLSIISRTANENNSPSSTSSAPATHNDQSPAVETQSLDEEDAENPGFNTGDSTNNPKPLGVIETTEEDNTALIVVAFLSATAAIGLAILKLALPKKQKRSILNNHNHHYLDKS